MSKMSNGVRLSLCLIARDSSRTLPDCLCSIAPWVDEMVVVDTGSTDETREIAAGFGARVFEFPWCDDFSAARNESLRHALGQWVFWMDSDDTISAENGRKLRELADQPFDGTCAAYVMQVHCPGPSGSFDVTVVDHVKMFRNDPRLRFENRIHEQILPAIRRSGGDVGWTDIFVTHSGSDHSLDARRRKQQRDLRLLAMELAEKPDHPFVLFNLGMTYSDAGEHGRAVEYLRDCLLASAPEESHVRKAYALLVGSLLELNQDDEARLILSRARELFSEDPELAFRQGVLEQRAKNVDAAIGAYHAAMRQPVDRYFSSVDRGITGYKVRHNLAVVYRELSRLQEAELEWRLALDEQPLYRDGWKGLVESLLAQRKLTTLEVEIESRQTTQFPRDELSCAEARLSIHRGDVQRAIEVLDASSRCLPLKLEPLRLKCQILFESMQDELAVAALRDLCERTPDDASAWHNLGTTLQRSGSYEHAIKCYETSLELRKDWPPTLQQLQEARQALAIHRSSDSVVVQELEAMRGSQASVI